MKMKLVAVLGGVLVMTAGALPAQARVRLKRDLAPTIVGDRAKGVARLVLKTSSEGEFKIQVRRLERNTTYAVIVAGTRVADVTTTGGGKGSARFRTRPRTSHDLPLGFDPRGANVVVRSAAGDDVLGVDFPDDQPGDAGDVVCCIPDDSGPECEDRTAAECAAEGGSVSGALSCLPNPCAGASPVEDEADIVCCLPDDSGPECEDRSQTECLAQGGTVVAATSCATNPCAGPGAPPPADEIACCVPSGAEGPECESRTPELCAASGGTPAPTGTCAPDPCGGSHGGADGSGGGRGRGRGGRG